MAVWRMRSKKNIYIITLICGRITEMSASRRKSESRNMMVTSDFRPKVEILPLRAMQNMQHNHHYRNISVIMDLAMGQIPRSTECISSLLKRPVNKTRDKQDDKSFIQPECVRPTSLMDLASQKIL